MFESVTNYAPTPFPSLHLHPSTRAKDTQKHQRSLTLAEVPRCRGWRPGGGWGVCGRRWWGPDPGSPRSSRWQTPSAAASLPGPCVAATRNRHMQTDFDIDKHYQQPRSICGPPLLPTYTHTHSLSPSLLHARMPTHTHIHTCTHTHTHSWVETGRRGEMHRERGREREKQSYSFWCWQTPSVATSHLGMPPHSLSHKHTCSLSLSLSLSLTHTHTHMHARTHAQVGWDWQVGGDAHRQRERETVSLSLSHTHTHARTHAHTHTQLPGCLVREAQEAVCRQSWPPAGCWRPWSSAQGWCRWAPRNRTRSISHQSCTTCSLSTHRQKR